MARFSIWEAEKYGGNGGRGFFSLKNLGDSARVRIMYDQFCDVEGYSVHSVVVDNKKRSIDCLRRKDDYESCCPFCSKKQFPLVKVYIPLYLVDEDRVVTWEKGKTYIPRLKKLFEDYATDKPLVSTVFEIKKILDAEGKIAFDITPLYSDDTLIEDLSDEVKSVYGGLVLQKSFEEMERLVG